MELTRYDPSTGKFFWRKNRIGGAKKGDEAGTKHNRALVLSINNKRAPAARLAWLYMWGNYPKYHVHHKNGNCFDNRIDNLICHEYFRTKRRRKPNHNNTSGVTGVYWDKRALNYYAAIGIKKRWVWLGCYKSFTDAVIARYEGECYLQWSRDNPATDAYLYLKANGLLGAI